MNIGYVQEIQRYFEKTYSVPFDKFIFRMNFGVSAEICSHLWFTLQSSELANGFALKHLFWTLDFLKSYATLPQLSLRHKTTRKHLMERVKSLLGVLQTLLKLDPLDSRFMEHFESSPTSFCALDVTACPTERPEDQSCKEFCTMESMLLMYISTNVQ
eukprot:Pompholyxophrys_punicea_v1_NODE_797_length_1279_cov_6.843137.p1 type:complete len:158 gc:universal NODE_797_length_1279_cov_6.843137:334-807(+)